MACSLSTLPRVIIMSAEFITGMTVNGFLVIMNCNGLIKSRRLMSVHLLLICIGMSRLGLQILLMIQSLFPVFLPLFYREKIYGTKMIFFWVFFSSVSCWFATCLSVFYCLKILGFTQSYFLWLRFRIAKFMPWLLLGSLVTSVSTAALCVEVNYPRNIKDVVLGNLSLQRTDIKMNQINEVFLVNLASVIPLAIFVICAFMLVLSLFKHSYRLQTLPQGFSNASTEAHVSALRTVTTFFCFFISYFAAYMMNMTFSVPFGSQGFFILKDIMGAYPSGHSVIIVLSNSKCQQSLRRILYLKKN